jgi:predicted phosphohydrolase
MRIQLVSDTHCEFYLDPVQFLDSLTFEPNLDVLVLAGDIVVPCQQGMTQVMDIFSYLSSKAKDIIFVAGNHSYYHGTKEQAESLLKSVLPSNFHWLQNTEVVIDNQPFFGGTMWFPEDPMNIFYKRNMCDFEVIRNLSDWVYTENALFTAAAERLVTPESIVVTHHLPSSVCTPSQFKGSQLNRFFVCEQSDLILEKKPKAWLFGHTHLGSDQMLGSTRLLSNPYGYPGERKFFRNYPPVVIET